VGLAGRRADQDLAGILVGYSVSGKLAELRLIAQNARARFQNASVQADAELGPLKQAYVAARNELTRFQSRHRIDRPTRDPAKRWTALGFLVILVSVESILNGAFFAAGDPFGWIGGIGTAIGISLVNVIFAYLLGLGPARFINYRNVLVRVFALLTTVIGLALLVALHGFAAHYRDASAAGASGVHVVTAGETLSKISHIYHKPVGEVAKANNIQTNATLKRGDRLIIPGTQIPEEHALPVALQTLMDEPWAVSSLSSGYLFGLGLLFAIGSFWKGYRFDDPYPFYGAVWRRSEMAPRRREAPVGVHAPLERLAFP